MMKELNEKVAVITGGSRGFGFAVEGYEERVQPLNTIIRMWAKASEIPARRAVWLASAATDGKSGLEVRELSLGWMLTGALKEGWQWMSSRQPKTKEVQVRTVQPYHPSEQVDHGDKL